MRKILLAMAIVAMIASCKDAPILVDAGVLDEGGKQTLFTVETVYTVTSKKSGGGMTTRGGYTTSYLNSIDVNTGENIERKKIGDFSDRVEFIASLGGKAWFFSHDPKVGLHTRDPKTLEIGVSVKEILAKNPSLAAGLSDQAHQSGIDTSAKNLFTTSKDGYTYLIDPITLVATKTDQKVGRTVYSSNEVTGTPRSQVNDSLEFSFSGSPRSTLEVTTEKFNQKSFDFFSSPGRPPSPNMYYDRAETKKFPDIDPIEPKLILNPSGAVHDHTIQPLSAGDIFFLTSKSGVGNDFNWMIYAITINYTGAKLQWKFTIDNTEKVSYSDKDLLSASIAGNKLVLVFENTMLALDKNTGALIWRKDIRTGKE